MFHFFFFSFLFNDRYKRHVTSFAQLDKINFPVCPAKGLMISEIVKKREREREKNWNSYRRRSFRFFENLFRLCTLACVALARSSPWKLNASRCIIPLFFSSSPFLFFFSLLFPLPLFIVRFKRAAYRTGNVNARW